MQGKLRPKEIQQFRLPTENKFRHNPDIKSKFYFNYIIKFNLYKLNNYT
jgi:hypothetical protein